MDNDNFDEVASDVPVGVCPVCKGTGNEQGDEPEMCATCRGSGLSDILCTEI
jgi:DnaJ-class molecular chaperone